MQIPILSGLSLDPFWFFLMNCPTKSVASKKLLLLLLLLLRLIPLLMLFRPTSFYP
jgi:hypothetical protein